MEFVANKKIGTNTPNKKPGPEGARLGMEDISGNALLFLNNLSYEAIGNFQRVHLVGAALHRLLQS